MVDLRKELILETLFFQLELLEVMVLQMTTSLLKFLQCLFALQKAISTTIREHTTDYWTGTVYTTNRRVWEYDKKFKDYIKKTRAYAIDMETATLLQLGFITKFQLVHFF